MSLQEDYDSILRRTFVVYQALEAAINESNSTQLQPQIQPQPQLQLNMGVT